MIRVASRVAAIERPKYLERPKCLRCRATMALTRRVPAPAIGPDYEFHLIECPRCGDTRIIAAGVSGRAKRNQQNAPITRAQSPERRPPGTGRRREERVTAAEALHRRVA